MRRNQFIVFLYAAILTCFTHGAKCQEAGIQSEPYARVISLIADFDSLYTIEPGRARGLINQALATSKSNNFRKEYGHSFLKLGKLHLNVGRYDSAQYCFEQALQVYIRIDEKRGVINCYKELGNVSVGTGKLEEGLEYYTKGLNLVKQNKFEDLEPSFVNNLGLVYLEQGHLTKALQYFNESASANEHGYDYAISINNIGVVKRKQGKLDEALSYFKKSLSACQDVGDEYCSITPLSGMASLYLEQKKYEQAFEVSARIIKAQESLGLEKDLMVSYNRMGLLYNEQESYDLALAYFYRALGIATHLNSGLTYFIHGNLSNTHEYLGQFEEALKHNILFYQKKDSLSSVEYKLRTEELLTKYETDKREKEISLLKKDKRLQEIEMENKQALYTKELLKRNLEEQENKYKLLHKNRQIGFLTKDSALQKAKIENKQIELERQTFFRNVAIVSAILIFIPTFILMVVYQQKVRNKELLALKTEEVNKQKSLELLRSFEIKTIKANIEGQEKEKQRLARELHDGVAGSLAAIKMRFQSIGQLLEDNATLKNLMQSVDEVYKEVRTISHHLTPPGMMQYSFVHFINKYLTEISQSSKINIEYIYHGEMALNQLTDDVKVEIYRILQELITNVIKHSKADLVEVQLMKQTEEVNLIVEDWGKGFDAVAKSAGLGLVSIKSRVDALGGQLNVDSAPKRGTIVSVIIPVDQ